jgi:erythromycin esterase
MNVRIILIFCTLVGWAAGAAAQSPLNLDFEVRSADPAFPNGWFVGGPGYEVRLDETNPRSGKVSLRIAQKSPGNFAAATSSLPVKAARGKKVRLSGEIKTEGVKTGYAGLWLRVDGPGGKTLGFDNMSVREAKDGKTVEDDRGVRGSAPWKRHAIEIFVDPAATNINFGCLHSGDGTAWFDALAVEIDGKPYVAAALTLKPEQIDWLKANAVPFATERAGHGFEDLKPLKAAIGGAHIVSLGEATHGTAEFFRMKHRLTEFLASEMGFTVFAIEASTPEAFRLNDYVLHGKGDPKELIRGMYFWTWNTQEVLDMVLWMRAFNESGKGRIEFLGFDMQEPKVAAENVRSFVAKSDPGFTESLIRAYAKLDSYRKYRQELAPGEGQPKREAALAEAGKLADAASGVVAHLEKDRDRLVRGSNAEAVDWAIHNARIVVQAVTLLTAPGDHRDRCMAENVDWILAHRPPGTKVVLWAHNGHVSKRPGAMGGFLSRRHGAEMVVVGFTFHEGRYTAVAPGTGLKANDAGPSEPGSIEWAFHQSGLPRAILDLRKVDKDSSASGWLAEPIGHRSIGALAMGNGFATYDLPENYDLLIFFDQTTASLLLPPHCRN